MTRTPAEILGISPYASHAEARKAYRALARRWHPDRFMPGPEREWAGQHMLEINTAYAEFTRQGCRTPESDAEDLSRVRNLIDDGSLTTARQLLMMMPTRCAEWNYLFGQLLMKLSDYKKAMIYLSVAANQEPDNPKYSAAIAQARKRMLLRRARIFR